MDLPAERWLRRGIAVVGCLLLVALVGGSAAPQAGRRPETPPTARAGGSPPPAPPGSPAPDAPEVLAPPPVLGADAGTQPAPTAAGVAHALAALLADRRLGRRVSATVLDARSGAVLLDRGGGRLATPASTAKLATAAAPGSEVLYDGAGRLADLAAAARRAGVRRVTRVVVDGSRYSGPPLAPGWSAADLGSSFAAPITAVAVDGGRASPRAVVRSTEPDLAAGRALAALLGAPAAAVVRGRAPAGAAVLGEVRSAPLARIVEVMLLVSDNVLAEALARQVALAEGLPATFAGAAEAVRRVLGRLGVPVAGDRLVDGSGLSRRDRMAPAVLAAVLRAAVSGGQPALQGLVPGLPVGGYDGTLGARYRAGPPTAAAGAVRAKTGSLNGVTALAGVVTDADGRLLVFAFLADRVPAGGTFGAEAALDTAAAALARCGCR